MSSSPAIGAQIVRGVPRFLLIAAGVGGVTSGSTPAELAGLVVLGSTILSNWKTWWRYVRTGERGIKAAEPPAEFAEPGDQRVWLHDAGERPVEVVKAIREVSGVDLFEAKMLIEGVPSIIAAGVSPSSAAGVRERLTGAGAKVVIDRVP